MPFSNLNRDDSTCPYCRKKTGTPPQCCDQAIKVYLRTVSHKIEDLIVETDRQVSHAVRKIH